MRRKLCSIAAAFLIILAVLTAGDIWLSANWLTTREYEYRTEKAQQDINFVVLSDMHNHEFGEENQKLVKKVRDLNPHIILLAGDIINEDSKNADIICNLVKELKKIAPVYLAYGNHELLYEENVDSNLAEKLTEAGAVVLEDEYVDVEINGTAFRMGGMYDYAFGLEGNQKLPEKQKRTKEFLEEFEDTEQLKIMMSHRPDSFIFGDAALSWDIDLVVSGHNHGGQIVLPVLGGVYGGDQGWFPEYVHGMYQKEKITMFVTSGLGSNRKKVPRINNFPEIAFIKIQKP